MTDELLPALKKLARAYVSLMENGRDRIVMLGGDCDPVDVMEAGDPQLRAAKEAIAKAEARLAPDDMATPADIAAAARRMDAYAAQDAKPDGNAQSEAVAFPGYAFCVQGRDGSGYKVSFGFETPEQGHAFHDAVIAAQKSHPAPQSEAVAVRALLNIRELNMAGADENGHRWANSDLIEQEVVFALTHPAPPLVVTEEMVDIRVISRAINKLPRQVMEVHDNNGDVFVSLHKVRAALTAASEAKQ